MPQTTPERRRPAAPSPQRQPARSRRAGFSAVRVTGVGNVRGLGDEQRAVSLAYGLPAPCTAGCGPGAALTPTAISLHRCSVLARFLTSLVSVIGSQWVDGRGEWPGSAASLCDRDHQRPVHGPAATGRTARNTFSEIDPRLRLRPRGRDIIVDRTDLEFTDGGAPSALPRVLQARHSGGDLVLAAPLQVVRAGALPLPR